VSTLIKNKEVMNEIKIFVRGMNCNHCKMNVENNLNQLEGINKTIADVGSETVIILGDQVDLTKVKETVEEIGYKFGGEVA
jgi:copper chaperone CopZ